MARTNRNARRIATNRNARIVSVFNGNQVATRTINRDEYTIRANVITTNDQTSLRIRTPYDGEFFFSGSEARTIYRTLLRHYQNAGLST